MLQANAVTADKIKADSLSAISANLGNVRSGTIVSSTIKNDNGTFSVDPNGNIHGANITGSTISADSIINAGFKVKNIDYAILTVAHGQDVPPIGNYSVSECTFVPIGYNITEKREKDAAYRALVRPGLMDELKEKILDIILIQKKYKDKDYSAKKLADDLGTNTRYISAVVNVKFHMNYTSFVNKYRIEEAMTLLADKRYRELNMEDISDMVGFSNRQSFYASFYKLNGCTPRDYKLRYQQQPVQTELPKKRGRKPGSKNAARAIDAE